MKRCLSTIIVCLTLYPTLSQTLQLGIVDHYGAKTVRQQAEACIPFSKKDTINFLTDSASADSVKKKMRECLKALPGVKQTDIALVCCDAVEGKVMLFIGALNKPMKSTAVTKTEDKKLPAEIIQSYDSLMQLAMEMVISGQGQEDDSEGHALLEFPAARKIQLRFRIYAKQHLEILRHVIRYSKYPEHRAAGATVIAYHDNKQLILLCYL